MIRPRRKRESGKAAVFGGHRPPLQGKCRGGRVGRIPNDVLNLPFVISAG